MREMKKLIYIFCLLFAISVLSSCNNLKPEVETPDGEISVTSAVLSIADFFPYSANTKYSYEGTGNEFASYTVFVDYLENNRVQIRENNGGAEVVKVLENKDGQLRLLTATEEGYFRENLLQTGEVAEILLQEPLEVGTSWILPDQRKRYISGVNVMIETALTSYQAIEVTTEDKNTKVLDYYAPGAGLVKTVFTADGTEITSSLSEIAEDAVFTQQVKFFYPGGQADKIYFQTKELDFKTNDQTRLAFEKAFKESPNEHLGQLITPNVEVKELYLNQDGIVYVDFSKELVREMNAGSGYEGLIIQSITNTLGLYYGSDKVYIMIEGKPYSSGHIELRAGEFFTVNLNNCFEIDK